MAYPSKPAPIIDYQALSSAFIIDNSTAVFAFLEQHAQLIPSILQAEQILHGFFPNEPYHLTVNQDPEYPAEWRVVISVSTMRDVDDALQRLDAFDEVWLPTLKDEARDLLLVTLVFF